MLNKKILAIDVGNKNIKIVLGKKKGNKVVVYKNFIVKTPNNSFSNGELSDIESIRKVLQDSLYENNIKINSAIVTINSSSIVTREIELPITNKKQIKKIINLEVKEYLPINVNEYIVEHRVLDKIVEGKQNKYKILIAALPKRIVESYMSLLKSLSLKPIALDYNSNTISSLFKMGSYIIDNQVMEETIALLDLGHNFININIITNGISKLTRTLYIGGNDVDVAIANTFNISISEAEEQKKYDGKLNNVKSDDKSSAIINNIISTEINNQAQKIENIFRYFTSSTKGNSIDKIFLYGGGCNLKGISKYITNYFNIQTYKIKYFKIHRLNIVKLNNVIMGKQADKGNFEYYLNCISSIIRN